MDFSTRQRYTVAKFRLLLTIWLFYASFCISFTESYEVNKIGSDTISSAGGPDVTGGSAVFLLNDPFPQTGVLFAFSAFFRNLNQLKFQVWRPSSFNTNISFALLAELDITPSVSGSAEVVYIVSQLTELCVRVRSGDRLGIYLANTTSSLAYAFNPFNPNPQILVHYIDGTPLPINLNDTVTFDIRIFPYDFSLTAYYYLETSKMTDTSITLDCPKNQLIQGDPKPSTPTTPVPTGIPGERGMIGKVGATGLSGPLGLIGASGAIGATGNIGPDGEKGYTGPLGPSGPLGLIGDTGAPGSIGLNGSFGATGYTGPDGPMGDVGLSGVVIFTNETYLFNDTEALPLESSSDRQWKSETYMKGSLIWLAFVSFILILLFILLVFFSCLYCIRHKEIDDISKNTNIYGMSNTLMKALPPSSFTDHGTVKSRRDLEIEEDLRDMREETFANYEVDTTEKYATKKLKDFTAEEN